MEQYHNNTSQQAFEYFNNDGCQWAFRTFSDKSYRIRDMINISDNNAVKASWAPLIPHKQQVINNLTTGDKNNIIADLKTFL